MGRKKNRDYIPLWKEHDWNTVCRDADAYYGKRKQMDVKKVTSSENVKVL
jgi:hypothetical protein